MTSNSKKMIIVSVILAISIILLLACILLGVNMGFFKILPVSSIIKEYASVKASELTLTMTQNSYYSTIKTLENSKTEYNKEKNKYNSISDETIEVIKEATTEEIYNLEYIWIKLGNYALKNNLEIVMVEPGGEDLSSSKSDENSNKTTTTTTNNNNTTKTNEEEDKTTTKDDTSIDPTALMVQVKGSYMNTSDFIFEVENDIALRFKLDNISMDYVSGSIIKTSFNVRNVVVNK